MQLPVCVGCVPQFPQGHFLSDYLGGASLGLPALGRMREGVILYNATKSSYAAWSHPLAARCRFPSVFFLRWLNPEKG
jgi:hypothetical protein